MIGRPRFVEAVKSSGLLLDTMQFQEIVAVETATELSAARGAQMILFSVKTTDTESVARELLPFVLPETIILSMQNGVDNAQVIDAITGANVLPAAVYVAAAMTEPGQVKHSGRGDLVIGPNNQLTAHVATIFERSGISCRISDNIEGDLWTKLIWNCAANAISALGNVNYAQLTANADGFGVLNNVVNEVLAVARAAGVQPTGLEHSQPGAVVAQNLAEQMGAARSSTARDLASGKRTEIDSLNGYVVRRGRELGVPTPVNHTLYTLVKLAEGTANDGSDDGASYKKLLLQANCDR
jgi:2-dehydropantoate 2-reductase